MPDHADDIAIVAAFLRHYADDRSHGIERTLLDYQQRFPGYEATLAAEYEALQSQDGGDRDPVAGDDRYSTADELARGGMGIVYRTWDDPLQRHVARKVLRRVPRTGDGTVDMRAADRFLREARITGQLGHPGIVPVHSLDQDPDGMPSFTMPIVEGRDLAQVIRDLHAGTDPSWTLPRTVEVVLRVCDAVAFAHDKQIVHRDLKPQNVMVGRFGEVYVLDLELTRSLATTEATAADVADASPPPLLGGTVDGDVIGTPAYMPPEQARGDVAAIDQRSDVYSIGAMLYELLAGRPPFLVADGDNASQQVLARVLRGPPAPLDALPRVPAELVAVCRKAMARAPEDRYQTVLDIAADLRAFLDLRVVHAYEVGALAELRKWVRRNRGFAAASAVALLALAAGFVVSATQKIAADHNALLAEQNLELAVEAGDDLLGHVGLYELENQAGADPLRQELAQKALAYYTRLQGLRGEDPRVLEKIALTHYRIAQLEAQIGHGEAAQRAWQAAWDANLQLAERFGYSDARRHRLATIESQMAPLLAEAGSPKAALARLEHAAATIAELRPRNPDSLALVGDAANIAHGLAMVRMSLGEPEVALQHCAQEIEDSRRMRELAPTKGQVHAQLGWSLQLQGMILWQLGRNDEAETSYHEAVRVLEAGRQVDATHRGMRFRLAEVQNLHALLLAQSDRDAEAEPRFERAVALLRELASEHPGVRSYHGNLGNCLCNLGILRIKQQRQRDSIVLYDEALPHLRRAMAIDPRGVDIRNFRRALGLEAATAALELGDHGRAAEDARAWMHDLPQGAHWPCGRLLALCAKIVADDTELAAAERSRLRDEYAAQAIEWLAVAVQQGKVRVEMLEHNAFDAIRERPDFVALLASLSK